MKEDFSELIEYLDGKFTKIDGQFVKIDERFVKIEGRLLNIEEKVSDLSEKKADKEDVNNLITAIDSYAKKADNYFQEMLMLANKVDRHEKWFHQIADKLGIRLEY